MNINFTARVGNAYARWSFARRIVLPLIKINLQSGKVYRVKVDQQLKNAVVTALAGIKDKLTPGVIEIIGYDFTLQELDSRDVRGSYSVGDLNVETEREDNKLRLSFSGFIFRDQMQVKRLDFSAPLIIEGWHS